MTPEQLFEENTKLAAWVATKFKNERDFEDVMQEAHLALFRACRRFDQSKGLKLSTYAVTVIHNSIIREFYEKKPLIKVPRMILENEVRVKRHLHNTQDVNELAELANISVAHVEEALEYMGIAIHSLQGKASTDGTIDTMLEEVVGSYLEDWDISLNMKHFISSLSDREQLVIEMLMQEKSQTEIGEVLGVHQVHVSRMLKKIRRKYEEYNAVASMEVELV